MQAGTSIESLASTWIFPNKSMTEERLLAEKESAQVRLNSIGDSVFCTDISQNINFVNSVAEKLTGWSFEEAKGRPIVEILSIEIAGSGKTGSKQMEWALARTERCSCRRRLSWSGVTGSKFRLKDL